MVIRLEGAHVDGAAPACVIRSLTPSCSQTQKSILHHYCTCIRKENGYAFLPFHPHSAGSFWESHLYGCQGSRPCGCSVFTLNDTYIESLRGWWLEFVWIHPKVRRQGLLKSSWPYFILRYGDFIIRKPFSDAMATFLQHYATPRQKSRMRID